MKITKRILKQIIREELGGVLSAEDEIGASELDPSDSGSEGPDMRSYTVDEIGSMVEDLVEMVSAAPWASGGPEELSEEKPKYKLNKDAEERVHGKPKPKPKRPPKKTDLQKAEERVKRAKDSLAKDPGNEGLKKRLASAKDALGRAKKVARGL